MSDRLFVGLSGLATDVQTLEQLLRFRLNMYKLREERDIKPETFSALLSHILYEKRCVGWWASPPLPDSRGAMPAIMKLPEHGA